MNITADESVDYRTINFLRKNSFHVIAIIDNDASISDTEVLKKANEQNTLLITEDKDFGELVFRFKLKHKGILLLRFFNTNNDMQNKKVLEVLQAHHKELSNSFSTLTDKKLRIRQIIP
jgi:predicted nuclease of predicted toxin-antitoxin system